MKDDCIFCKIVRGEAPADKVYEDEGVVAFKNIEPKAEIHYLIVPKKHVVTFMDAESEVPAVMSAANEIVKEKNLGEGYKLIVNGGKYQQVQHFHIHLLSGKLEDVSDTLNQT